MFELDRWYEIWATLRHNKVRTILTALSVAWGIFMLMFMLGAGKGLENGVMRGFGNLATNMAWVWGQKTTMPYMGMQAGRFVRFDSKDMEQIRSSVPGVERIAPRIIRGGYDVIYGLKKATVEVRGDMPDFLLMEPSDILEGRFINTRDIKEKRKSAVIGKRIQELLFSQGETPIGKYIRIKGVYFQVVGVFKSTQTGQRAAEQENGIFIPFPTMQQVFTQNDKIDFFSFTAVPGIKVSEVLDRIKEQLKKRYRIHPKDTNVIGSANLEDEYQKMQGLFMGINGLVLIVGTLTILAGVIGVSNIMLIVVRERTKEIGLRKALGATPISVVMMIMQEAIVLTLASGYVGLLLGVGLIDLIRRSIGDTPSGDDTMFWNPLIPWEVGVGALLFLVISGMFAGLLPALKAVAVSPVEALRDE